MPDKYERFRLLSARTARLAVPGMITDRFRLDGRVALVTGAGRGIGAATALALAEAGADMLVSARTAADLEVVARRVEALGRRARVVAADLSEPDAVAALADAAVEALGRLDVVVNNVGGAMPAPFTETPVEVLEEAFRFNVGTAHALTRAALPHLRAAADAGSGDGLAAGHGPSVVSISSAYGHRSGRGMVAYGTAKAALLHWTRMSAADLAPRIRVNAVAAGVIASSAMAPVLEDPSLRSAMEQSSALRRFGAPEDVAAAVLFLVSPAGAYVNGAVLDVDGGPGRTNVNLDFPDV